MTSTQQSTLNGARNACPESAVMDSSAELERIVRSGAESLVFFTGQPMEVSDAWALFTPADAGETERVVALAQRMDRPSAIYVTDEPVPQTTGQNDVLELGLPNAYTLCGDAVVISCGPVLHIAKEARDLLASEGIETRLINLPSLQPLRSSEFDALTEGTDRVVAVTVPDLVKPLESALNAWRSGVRVLASVNASAVASAIHDSDMDSENGIALSERMGRLGTENAFVVLAEVNKLKAEGRDIASFAIGEPDFPTPENIRKAGIEAIVQEKTHYSESQGILPLREAIADYIGRTRDIEVGPGNVVVTPGAKPIMFNTMMALVNPGDEVIYPNPGFPIYESLIEWIGGKAVPLPLWESLDFNFSEEDFRAAVTDRTKLIILNSPHNPTGSILTPETLRMVAEVAVERDIWVLSDEIYSQMVYDGDHASIAALPGMKERTIILDGFSKTYSMTGWRLGFGVMPEELAQVQARIETNLNSCTATFTQWAGVEALNGDQSESRAMIAELEKRRHVIVEGLRSIPGFACIMPHGAFYAFPNVTEACHMLGMSDAKELQTHILYEGNVAVLPRTSFGRLNVGEAEQYVRFSYASSLEDIEKGLARIRAVMS
jgi:aspartate aminotransferase